MPAPRSHAVSLRRFFWLLWLALLLPIGQVAAASHALSHLRSDTSREVDGKQAPLQTHCDLCLLAAAVSGGALPGAQPALAHPVAVDAAPPAASIDVWLATLLPVYRSRAPPSAPH